MTPLAAVTSQWTPESGARRALVAVCCSERMVHRESAASLVNLAWGGQTLAAARHHGFAALDFAWFERGVRVDGLRNQAVRRAIEGGYSHLVFLDADMVWPVDVLDRLLAHHAKGIVSGVYFLKRWPYWPVALRNPKPDATGVDRYEYDCAAGDEQAGMRREALVGMGCTIIPVAILTRMDAPWFSYKNDGEGLPSVTEDVAFCEQAGRLHCPIWVDPSIQCGHVSVQTVTAPWFHRGLYEFQQVATKPDGSAA